MRRVTGFGAVVDRADVSAGSSVLVVGTGGVGLNCVQGAALRGATPIIAADVFPSKRETAMQLGATPAFQALSEGTVRITTRDPAIDPQVDERMLSDESDLVRHGDLVPTTVRPEDAFPIDDAGRGWQARAGEAVDLMHNDVRILGSKMGSARLDRAVPHLVALYEQGLLKLDELITGRIRSSGSTTR